ncbi:Non-specific serine/threonine protein kinase protein [Dioscorea alata]|uniref:Non-specific serine/threonine protein kinase protein n=1 Tax=Dioscorea alata TaxID=55571 RepID=A0ACB7WUK5_DIOAL|nr:Non-specific serine/threonine protein kinase protein [Dioscorea alata]
MFSTKCLETERQTLLQFKSGLSDPAHRLSSWTGDDCCSWMGVACSNDVPRHVIKLDLRIRIPEFIGSFKKLEYLNLSKAGFTGTIPHHLGNLSMLKSLDLSINYWQSLVIDNAGWLSRLTSLKYLNMSYVDMLQASNWLPVINMLPSLLEIRLSFCDLSGPLLNLPFVNFTSLSTLDLSFNHIDSSLPDWLFDLSNLEYMYLNGNHFEGKIPSNIGNLTFLKALDLSSYFSPSNLQIPSTLGNLCNLHTLSLSYLDLSLEQAKLGRIFSGCIINSLTELDLSSTSLNGSLPGWLGTLTNLKILDLSSNEGLSLSTSLSNLCKLQTLSLNGLDLSKEAAKTARIFSGCIVQRLKELHLANTNLQGDMPYWIDGLENLKLLDLSLNQINSTLPHWLC